MDEVKTENETPTNEEEVVEETTTEEEETPKTLSEEEIAELQKKAELADNYKIRAEKAEAKVKKIPKVEKVEVSEDNLSTKDVLALTSSNISADDYDEVIRVSKILGKDVNEALQDPTLKTILATRAEERTTADATNTTTQARGSNKTDGEALLKKAESGGEMPQDEEGFKKLAEAQMARKKANAK